jgi:hypothetical protein
VLVEAVKCQDIVVPEANSFASSVEAVQREILSAADLVCWELRTRAVRTRAGNVNAAQSIASAAAEPRVPEIERQSIYTLNPLLWREGSEVKKAPAFALVELPKALLPMALRHQHVDYLNARRVQTLMHVHGSGGVLNDAAVEDMLCIDLDALATDEQADIKANVA